MHFKNGRFLFDNRKRRGCNRQTQSLPEREYSQTYSTAQEYTLKALRLKMPVYLITITFPAINNRHRFGRMQKNV